VNILHQMGKLLGTIAFGCFFFFVVFSREVFMVVFSAKYLAATSIFICTLLALPARAYNFTALLQIHGKGNTINKGVLIDAIVAIIFFIPLYFLLGLKGVALSFVLGTYAQAAYYLIQAAKLSDRPLLQLIPLQNWLLKFLLLGGFMLVLHASLRHFFDEKVTLLAGCLITGCLGVFILWREGKRAV
jgi:O-antigen/teichoic acid export membrane protein